MMKLTELDSMSRSLLVALCCAVLLAMIAITTYASLDRSILNLGRQLLSDAWFLATLCDAYCGFLLFYSWVAYKERSTMGRVVWFILIMGLGNMATATYLLREIWRMKPGDAVTGLLLRRD